MQFPRRAANSWRSRDDGDDYSHAVKEAMDGCLACKSCVGQCPIKVDVPAFRSRFLELYYGRYLRPPRDRLVASLERVLPWLARLPRITNAVLSSHLGRAALARVGLVALPDLDGVDVRRVLQARGVRDASADALSRLSSDERRKTVVVVQDAFTSYYDSRVVLDFFELLERLGFTAWLAPFRPNGKPQHVLGYLGPFERTARDNAAMLQAIASTGVDLVGIDPSMTLTYRAEYVKAIGKEHAPAVALPQEWLARHIEELPRSASDPHSGWTLLPHCTERTNVPASVADWQRVCRRFGVELNVPSTGCCGMAGLYGHEKANRARSEAIWRQSWANHLADSRHAGRVLATGYSCRSQAAIVDGTQLLHPVQLLLRQIKVGAERRPVQPHETDAAHHEEY
jgi:Fe-S oxidoreductase